MNNSEPSFLYVITLGESHILPCLMLIRTLRPMTRKRILVIGNLQGKDNIIKLIQSYGVDYVDENEIKIDDRVPAISWTTKFREWGWYKQQFIRLCLDRYVSVNYIVLLDSEVFVFDNWDESRLFNDKDQPRLFSWIPQQRKPEWDYKMYQGSAYLLQDVPGCEGIMEYANTDQFRRHISGLFLWSRKNLAKLWQILEQHNGLKRLDELLNHVELSFSEMELYGLAVKYGLFDESDPTETYNGLLGWYDVHAEPEFQTFKEDAMWSMCQNYRNYQISFQYWAYMVLISQHLGRELPKLKYWNLEDETLLMPEYIDCTDMNYFLKYQLQLDFTDKKRFQTMFTALKLLSEVKNPVIVETGTLRDSTMGGGHSTYKFAEFATRFGGKVYTVDISEEGMNVSRLATYQFRDVVSYHTMDSVQFLHDFSETIDFLYLDSFDSSPGQEEEASQHQLNEIKEAMPKLAEQAIVLLDDAALPNGGKTRYSPEFLESHGFKLLIDDYQKLYFR